MQHVTEIIANFKTMKLPNKTGKNSLYVMCCNCAPTIRFASSNMMSFVHSGFSERRFDARKLCCRAHKTCIDVKWTFSLARVSPDSKQYFPFAFISASLQPSVGSIDTGKSVRLSGVLYIRSNPFSSVQWNFHSLISTKFGTRKWIGMQNITWSQCLDAFVGCTIHNWTINEGSRLIQLFSWTEMTSRCWRWTYEIHACYVISNEIWIVRSYFDREAFGVNGFRLITTIDRCTILSLIQCGSCNVMVQKLSEHRKHDGKIGIAGIRWTVDFCRYFSGRRKGSIFMGTTRCWYSIGIIRL